MAEGGKILATSSMILRINLCCPFWVMYIGNYAMAKIGWTELGLEDISFAQGDIRLHLTPEALNDKFHVSIGVKHRQHPVYGFDAMVLDTTWYGGQWWAFAEDAFGIDDNMWYDESKLSRGIFGTKNVF